MLTKENYTLEQSRENIVTESNDVKPLKSEEIRQNLIWPHIFVIVFLHAGFVFACSVYGFGLSSVRVKWLTVLWGVISCYLAFIGITAGAHRLWSHRAYKANLNLRIILLILYSFAGLYSLFQWIKDHRVHHKYSDTDADPHNASRGFFFAHLGWVLVERHPECLRRGREVDLRDIYADPVVMFNKKYVIEMYIIFCIAIPVAVPIIFWGETLLHAILTQYFIRYLVILHVTLCGNSVAHLWGDRPYNSVINPRDNIVLSLLTGGEGSHNYHHTFPWDYKGSEWPYMQFNLATLFIRAFSKLEWAYDLREPSPTLVQKVIQTIGHKSDVSS
ncbi:acyl-CoA Delta-9 desaturase-like [Diprion similis]|uniref:acyl-CoA Delta-9 desaturase-like n=1 Tax=Diprion similis TaxID=362088 RepID=UPI001EF7CA5A|nr:acyl-CoA Delta-9 desaturase-like [Diprion similis]